MINILRAKLSPPSSPTTIARPALAQQLATFVRYPLAIICAGPGYGKTTALCELVQSSLHPCAWYSLDQSDRDLTTFAFYLIAAIQTCFPDSVQDFSHQLNQLPPDKASDSMLEKLALSLALDLQTLPLNKAHHFALVLEDFHVLEGSDAARLIAKVVPLLPPNCHLIISSRQKPSDLNLTPLLARRQLLLIETSSFSFTPSETDELVQLLTGTANPKLSQFLHSYSQGWVTALILGLNEPHGGDLSPLAEGTASFTPHNYQNIFDYLASEVLAAESAELQSFLRQSSALDKLTPGLCAELMPEISVAECGRYLRQLTQRNLFVYRLADQSYQYHALFHIFLKSLLAENDQLYIQVHERAARLYQQYGHKVSAVQCFLAARNVEQAVTLLDDIADELYESGQRQVLNELMGQIPAADQLNRPSLVIVKARLFMQVNDNQAALELFGRAEKLYRVAGELFRAAEVMAQQAQIIMRMGRWTEAERLCNEIVAVCSTAMSSPDTIRTLALTYSVLGIIATHQNQWDEAENYLKTSFQYYNQLNSPYRLAVLNNYFGRLYHQQGRLAKSSLYLERALVYFEQVGSTLSEAYCRLGIAINQLLLGHYTQAHEQLDVIATLSSQLTDNYLSLYTLTYQARSYRERGQISQALALYHEALRHAKAAGEVAMQSLIWQEQALAEVLQGNSLSAQTAAAQGLELAIEQASRERLGQGYLTAGLVELAFGNFGSASNYLEQGQSILVELKLSAELSRLWLNKATIRFKSKQIRPALQSLEQALKLVQSIGYEPFLPLELKLADALFEYAAGAKVSTLIKSFLERRGFAATSRAVRPATTATLELRGLQGGKVFVAGRELISWRTVKTYELLFFLADYPGSSRDQILAALWPETEFSSADLFYSTVTALRQAIKPFQIIRRSNRYYIEGDYNYDVADFVALIKAKAFEPTAIERVLLYYQRDYLDHSYSDWVLKRQNELLGLYLSGLGRLADYYTSAGHYEQALSLLRQLVKKEPYNEEAYVKLIELLMTQSRLLEAREQYLELLDALNELELRPTPAIRKLGEQLGLSD